MAYKVIILYRLYMPSYFLGTFTEYPNLLFDKKAPCLLRRIRGFGVLVKLFLRYFTSIWIFPALMPLAETCSSSRPFSSPPCTMAVSIPLKACI